MQQLKDMDFTDLTNFCAGQALTRIGEGRMFREVILDVIHAATQWQMDKITAKKVDRQPSDVVIKAKVVNAGVSESNLIYTYTRGSVDSFQPNLEYVFRGEELIDVKLIKA